MKRLVPALALFLGASVCSQAAIITSATGAQLLGSGGALIDFESVSLPAGAFTSLPFNITSGGVTASFTAPATGTFANAGGVGNNNGVNAAAAFSPSDNRFLSNWNYTLAPTANPNSNYTNRILVTFNSGLSGLEFAYSGNDSFGQLGTALAGVTLNRAVFQTCTGAVVAGVCQSGAGTEAANFDNQFANANNNRIIQWTSTTPGAAVITGVLIEINGLDSLKVSPDYMVFDNFRAFTGAIANSSATTPPPTSVTSGPGNPAVPEPSTYALIGAGLAALAYARRK